MNTESINAALINELIEDSIQRVSTTFNVAAVLRPGGRVRARAPVGATARAELVSLWKTLVRSSRTVVAPAAHLTILGLNRSRTKLTFAQSVLLVPHVTVYPRRNISQGKVTTAPRADLAARFKTFRPSGSLPIAAIAVLLPAPARSYERFRVQVPFTMQVRVTVSGDTVKQIPYDEDAPDIRVMYVPFQNREMKVG